ncbi:MAG TPA: phosphoenolpyruvate synthase [Methylomusa anaerophila]|uniref:Phosphoenolpyruvate synthase n=1 Tax=Methylomusa anaerophila TaxID=1930071 RepID=A0A348ALI3_9FIRM|nr:phosphoenolpyruvate synthase [Methylomusa anaerophila]BBB91931.1 phosphoenolpyruvate synthase [Methylomusa anaerophila]HML88056.1 phosphoenolpyruvate synthase [Methylomusa anaerophila]
MGQYVLFFNELNKASVGVAGGKAANLGELYQLPGVQVPPGFCITTAAYHDFAEDSSLLPELLRLLEQVDAASPDILREAGESIRSHLESLAIPAAIEGEIFAAWEKTGSDYAYAVRSSATLEDLPGASFAGQHDTFLNIQGRENILTHVRKCWASLFTDRAILYRRQNGFQHDKVRLSVIVQRMVLPAAAGIMFTADPVTGNRKVVSIDASFGLGESLVAGIVSADLYKVKNNSIIVKQIAQKKLAVYGQENGGTTRIEVPVAEQNKPSLTDESVLKLAAIGKNLEKHFGSPQDIEWCLADNEIYILQSRPITTLYPLPQTDDRKLRFYISLGHAQMMTDPIKPLGISVLRTLAPFGKKGRLAESPFLQEAGGRLYIDITNLLANPLGRRLVPKLLLNVDAAIGRAVMEFTASDQFKSQAATKSWSKTPYMIVGLLTVWGNVIRNIMYRNNPSVVRKLNGFITGKVKENQAGLAEVSGADRIRKIQTILSSLLPAIFRNIAQYLGAALLTYKLIDGFSRKWLGDARELGSISKSPPGNVTSEMGLQLGDIADMVRKYPAVAAYLKTAADDTFFTGLGAVPGGIQVQLAFMEFLARYGMRATGEIDITRDRWREKPTQMVPAILSHIESRPPGQHRLEFSRGKREAAAAAERLAARLRNTKWGFLKAKIMSRFVKVHRALIGVREHPKYFLVQNLDIIKQGILKEGEKLCAVSLLRSPAEVYWLSLSELAGVLETGKIDRGLIYKRQEQFKRYEKLTPPRTMTSEGEIYTGNDRNKTVPQGAFTGSPVSAGVVEGRARVILTLTNAKMNKGDILVTPFTDPGWTPLFPLAAGLVTEVGGLMTHGAVVAREYGIPAVAGVDGASRLIKDGQYIRVDGSQGFVEILQ